MACTYRSLEQQIAAEPAQVREFYVDLSELAEVHPLVVSVQTTGTRRLADGYEQTYRIRDRIPFGRLALPIRYTTRLTVPRDGAVTAESRQFPRVRLHSVVSFVARDGGTLLTERIRFCAPWPLAGVTVRRGVAAHREMLAGIAAHFAG